MDKSTNYLSKYISEKGINIKKMAKSLGLSYNSIYNSLGERQKSKNRPLRGDEFLAICGFLNLNPKDVMNEIKN